MKPINSLSDGFNRYCGPGSLLRKAALVMSGLGSVAGKTQRECSSNLVETVPPPRRVICYYETHTVPEEVELKLGEGDIILAEHRIQKSMDRLFKMTEQELVSFKNKYNIKILPKEVKVYSWNLPNDKKKMDLLVSKAQTIRALGKKLDASPIDQMIGKPPQGWNSEDCDSYERDVKVANTIADKRDGQAFRLMEKYPDQFSGKVVHVIQGCAHSQWKKSHLYCNESLMGDKAREGLSLYQYVRSTLEAGYVRYCRK